MQEEKLGNLCSSISGWDKSMLYLSVKVQPHVCDFGVTATSDRFCCLGGRSITVTCHVAGFRPARKFRLSPGSLRSDFCRGQRNCATWQQPVSSLQSEFALATCSLRWQQKINSKISHHFLSSQAEDKVPLLSCHHWDQLLVLMLLGLRHHRESCKCFEFCLPNGTTAFHAGSME